MTRNGDGGGRAATPEYWTQTAGGGGGTTLVYAVRGGGTRALVTALGAAFVVGGAWSIWYLVAGGGLTAAGFVFLLVPAGAVLAGVYCLDVTLRASSSYLLGPDALSMRRSALFGGRALRIPRSAVTGVSQRYSPPGRSAPTGAPGTWVTAIGYRADGGPARELVLDGLGTPEEARWLGPLLGAWAGAQPSRGFAGGFAEADPAELPGL